MSNINKIKVSGQTYNIQDQNATKTLELTQAEYDALAVKDPNTFYIITDSEGIDLSNYYTKSETSGATQISTALASKANKSEIPSLDGYATETWVEDKGYLTEHQSLSNYYTKSETSGATQISTALASKQSTLESGTNIKTINNESILGSGNITIEGGGKAVAAGTNISITTGETADTINCTLSGGTLINISNNKINCSAPIKYGTGINSVIVGSSITTNKASGQCSIANGGDGNTASGQYSFAEGYGTQATKHSSHSEGFFTIASGNYSHTEGNHTNATNESEHASGKYNVSSSASTTWGDSGNTLFSVGNGTSNNARHNAFEIRQNGDIYITSGSTDIKLQDHLGGGGGGTSYTAGDGIDITNDVISVTGKVDTTAFTAHTADTVIHVTSAEKAAWNGKQDALVSGTNIKTINGETLLGEGNITIEGGSDINVVQTTGTSTADVMSQDAVTTQLNNKANKTDAVGGYQFGKTSNVENIKFKAVGTGYIGSTIYYPSINGKGILTNNLTWAKDNYNFQLVETSAITTSVTSSSTDAQVPSAKAVNDQLGGLKLVKLTQSEYDALSTKDNSTLYIVTDS